MQLKLIELQLSLTLSFVHFCAIIWIGKYHEFLEYHKDICKYEKCSSRPSQTFIYHPINIKKL